MYTCTKELQNACFNFAIDHFMPLELAAKIPQLQEKPKACISLLVLVVG